jgi:hypothetical protein
MTNITLILGGRGLFDWLHEKNVDENQKSSALASRGANNKNSILQNEGQSNTCEFFILSFYSYALLFGMLKSGTKKTKKRKEMSSVESLDRKNQVKNARLIEARVIVLLATSPMCV